MKVNEAKKLLKLIRDVYSGNALPEEFAEASGLYDSYLSELWPPEPDKLVGDWILERFDLKQFLDEDKVKQFSRNISNELKEVLFFANLPDRASFDARIRQMQTADDAGDFAGE